jgi:hypothetical protein
LLDKENTYWVTKSRYTQKEMDNIQWQDKIISFVEDSALEAEE